MPKKNNKMPKFYMIFARKIFFPEFWGASAPCPLVSYAYDFSLSSVEDCPVI